jgi:hypothetical protein
LLGYWAAALWVIAPFAVIPLFVDRYHEKWVDQFLPQALGLTAMPDYPSMVLVLLSAFFVVRSLERDRLLDAVVAGLLLGAAGGLKPPNYLFVLGAVLAYPVARRWREGVAFGLAIVPSLVLLAFWKWSGLGELPVLALEQARLAAGGGPPVGLELDLGRYLDLDVNHWRDQMNELREFFWSARLAQWAPLAGLLAVLRVRRFPIAALLAGWLAAFIVVKGFSSRASIEANTFWRLLMPAWPAYLLLFASIPLLVPTLARRLGDRIRPAEAQEVTRRAVVVVAILTLAVPAVTIAAASPSNGPDRAVYQDDAGNYILTAVENDVHATARRVGSAQELTWTTGGPWRANVFFRVYRTDGPGPDIECENSDGSRAQYCYLRSTAIATTREPSFVDTAPPAGAVTYRIGVATNWADDPAQGDVFAFSPPVTAAR